MTSLPRGSRRQQVPQRQGREKECNRIRNNRNSKEQLLCQRQDEKMSHVRRVGTTLRRNRSWRQGNRRSGPTPPSAPAGMYGSGRTSSWGRCV